jgi:hypothetical protein
LKSCIQKWRACIQKWLFFTEIAKVGYLSQRSGQKPNQHEMVARTLSHQDNSAAQEQGATRTCTEEPTIVEPVDDQPADARTDSTPSAGRTLSHY